MKTHKYQHEQWEIYKTRSVPSGVSGTSGTSCCAGSIGLSDIVRTIKKAFNELKIEEDYSYSYDSKYSTDYKSITYIVKLLNLNNEELYTMELTNITSHDIFLDKIKLNLKQYFRDINLNKLIK